MNKVKESVEQAIADIDDGAVVAIGGFFAAGVPRVLLRALIAKGTKNLTFCCGSGPLLGAKDELEQLVSNGQIKKVIDSYPLFRSATKGLNHGYEQQVRGSLPHGYHRREIPGSGRRYSSFLCADGCGFHGGRVNANQRRESSQEEGYQGDRRATVHFGICVET
ncbi:MAG: CoA transferase subunit [Deltaproteobacteria bacterium]|nr:CoA transferase subunit [Deltaproteobacteria bacterium]